MKDTLTLLLTLCALFMLPQVSAKETDSAIPIATNLNIEMIDSGYTMGDKLKMQARFELAAGEKIDPDSLPLVGRVRPWLDMTKVNFEQSDNIATLTTVWQLFATVEIAQQLTTPPIVLKTTGSKPTKLQIPSQKFYYSPVLPLPPLKDIERRANHQPPAFDTTTPMLKFLASLFVFGLLAFIWAWLKDAVPWLPFKPGPMTKLARSLKASHQATLNQAQLKQIHAALNASAGQNLYGGDLSPLIQNAPYFANVQAQVADFFQASWQQFYAPEQVTAPAVQADEVYGWVKNMAVAERMYRKQHKQSVYAG